MCEIFLKEAERSPQPNRNPKDLIILDDDGNIATERYIANNNPRKYSHLIKNVRFTETTMNIQPKIQ